MKNIIIRTISCRDTSKGEDSGTNRSKCKKGKGMFLYSAVSRQLARSKRFTLHRLFIPAPTQLLWEAFLPITRKEYSLTLPALSIARYSFIQWRERRCPNFETVAGGVRTRALAIVSPAFYRAPKCCLHEDLPSIKQCKCLRFFRFRLGSGANVYNLVIY